MLEFIYILRPTRIAMVTSGPTDRERSILSDHLDHLMQLASRGEVALAGRTTTEDDRVIGMCILRAESESAARSLMLADPAIAHGIMSADLFPFRIAVMKESP